MKHTLPLIPSTRSVKLSPTGHTLFFLFYEFYEGIWPPTEDYLSQHPLCVRLCDQAWGNGVGVEVMCEISRSCPLRQKCALDSLFPHSHSQKTATRRAAIRVIMETTWRKAKQTCHPKPLEHRYLPALDCSLSFVLSHI